MRRMEGSRAHGDPGYSSSPARHMASQAAMIADPPAWNEDVQWCLTDPENAAGRVGYYVVVGLLVAGGLRPWVAPIPLAGDGGGSIPARRRPRPRLLDAAAALPDCPLNRTVRVTGLSVLTGMGAAPRGGYRSRRFSCRVAPRESRPDRGQGRSRGCVSRSARRHCSRLAPGGPREFPGPARRFAFFDLP